MSGFEKEELTTRSRGTTKEEQLIIARELDDDILWDELRRRYMIQNAKVKNIEEAIKE